ncbi:MAG: zinc ribbon domain-containing protein [Chlamydiota bacterium]
MRRMTGTGVWCVVLTAVLICSAAWAAVCPRCGTEVKDEWKCCPMCAAPLEKKGICPSCGKKMEEGWKACPYCGHQLAASPAQAPGPTPVRAPETAAASSGTKAQENVPEVSKVLWDFENERDLKGWKFMDGLNATVGPDHATSGKGALKITFPSSTVAPAFRNEGVALNFDGYDYLQADFYNPETHPIDICFKLKSSNQERQTTLNYHLPPETAYTMKVPLKNISSRIDVNDVAYINFFCWQPSEGGTYYLDNIRLSK